MLETDIHYPTDLDLLWEAQRKCADGLRRWVQRYGLPGWRQEQGWRRQLKGQMIGLTRLLSGGGPNRPERRQAAVRKYVQTSYRFEQKCYDTLRALPAPAGAVEVLEREQLDYFHTLMIKLLDLLERRLVAGQTITQEEKIFSIFEPHTPLVKKGKLFPPIEFGHKLLLATDQHELILDYRVMDQPNEVDEAIPLADRLWERYGPASLVSLSFDQGFTREEDRQLLALYIPQVIMPKRGKRNAVEAEREHQRRFVELRHQHHAIESDINCLEHHGLNRCLDQGLPGFKRYVGLGVLAYHLHKIGAQLLARQRAKAGREPGLRLAA